MKLFIDCEFNDFRGDLISMAIVPEDEFKPHFYEVLECRSPSPWVAENVMPKLNKQPVPKTVFQVALMNYLKKYEEIHLIADWPEDIKHFCEALIAGPGLKIPTPKKMTFEIMSLDIESEVPHNALEDAFAIRQAYLLTL